jgi:hypothetical protein
LSRYRYFGLLFGRLNLRLSLDSAWIRSVDGHAAVWLGASSHDARDWIQAGIEFSHGDATPSLYVEIGRDGGQEGFYRRPWELGKPATVKLRRLRSGSWTVKVEDLRPSAAPLPSHPSVLATLETYGRASASARIGRRRVRS